MKNKNCNWACHVLAVGSIVFSGLLFVAFERIELLTTGFTAGCFWELTAITYNTGVRK